MRFAYPWFLLLLSVIPFVALFWIWLFRRSQRALDRFVAPALQGKLLPPNGRASFYLQAGLSLGGLVLLLLAAARPQWGRQDVVSATRGRNVVIALDVSRSMLAEDVSPNRLERAKADLMDLIGELKGDRAALVAFRKKGILICPLTSDYGFLRQSLDGVSPDSAPRGETDLGDAIRASLDALNPALDEYSAIILISDGGNLHGDVLDGAKKAADRGIPIFTVGIGDTAGATIPDPSGKGRQQYQGKSVKTKLEEKTLASIAQASNGRYLALGTAGTADTTLGSIYRKFLRQISVKEQKEKMENRYQERFQLFLIPAILFLLSAAWFSRGRLRGTLRRAVAALFVLVAGSAAAQTNETSNAAVPPGRQGARIAQGYLKDGAFEKAAEAFLSALRGAEAEEADEYRYNAAYAYYQASNAVAAAEQLRPLLHSKKIGPKAGEFLGKILLETAASHPAETNPQTAANPGGEENGTPERKRLEELEEAASAFQKALRSSPQDERANRNFTRAVSPLAAARTDAHIAEVLKANQGAGVDSLAGRMLAEQRAIQNESRAALTNADAAARISFSEALAKRQEANADLWIPLKAQVLQQVTNQQQQAQLVQIVEGARASMKGTARALQDVNPDAISFSGESVQPVYALWRLAAGAPALIDEDILRQTNAIHSLNLPYLDNATSQAEAKSLTQQFIEVFPKWAEKYRQQASQNTNQPPFTAEDEAKIQTLAQETLELQTRAASDEKGEGGVNNSPQKNLDMRSINEEELKADIIDFVEVALSAKSDRELTEIVDDALRYLDAKLDRAILSIDKSSDKGGRLSDYRYGSHITGEALRFSETKISTLKMLLNLFTKGDDKSRKIRNTIIDRFVFAVKHSLETLNQAVFDHYSPQDEEHARILTNYTEEFVSFYEGGLIKFAKENGLDEKTVQNISEKFEEIKHEIKKYSDEFRKHYFQNKNQKLRRDHEDDSAFPSHKEGGSLDSDSKVNEGDLEEAKRAAYEKLLEIRKLLPKDPNQQQQQQKQDQQQQQQQQQQQEQKQDEQKQQEQKQQEQKNEQEAPKDVKELLRRALEREKEHEEEKKERMRKLPLAPDARDW